MVRFLTVILSIFLFFGCKNQENTSTHDEPTTQTLDRDKDSFTLQLVDGGVFKIKKINENQWNFNGFDERLKLLFFFSSQCEPCRAIIAHLVDIQEQYSNKLEIIGIILDENKTTQEIQDFLQSYNVNFKVSHYAQNKDLFEAISTEQILPFSVLYNGDGEYILHYTGAVPQEMIEFDIKRTLEQDGEDSISEKG